MNLLKVYGFGYLISDGFGQISRYMEILFYGPKQITIGFLFRQEKQLVTLYFTVIQKMFGITWISQEFNKVNYLNLKNDI